jgi:hypothetical protein
VPAEPDVIEQGRPRRARSGPVGRLLGRRTWGRPTLGRTGRLVVLAVVVACLVLAVVDWRVRVAERPGVRACTEAAGSAVGAADARLRSMVSAVQPALSGSPPPERRRKFYAMVSTAADRSTSSLERARRTCAATGTVVWHRRAGRTRQDCVDLVDGTLRRLAVVTRDGSAGFDSQPAPAGACPRG